MNPPNPQGQMPRQVSGQGSNDGQNFLRQNVPPPVHGLPQQYYPHQYPPNHQFSAQQQQQQQHHFHQYNVGPQYGGQHLPQSQNLPPNNAYQPQSNVFQQQIPRFHDRSIGHQFPVKDDQQFQASQFRGTNFVPGMNDRNFPGGQNLHLDPNRHIAFQQQERSFDGKVMAQHFQHLHGQRIGNQRYEQMSHQYPLPPTIYYGNQKRTDIQGRPILEIKREILDNLSEEEKRKLSMAKNLQNNLNDYQQSIACPPYGTNLDDGTKNVREMSNQLESVQFPMTSQDNQFYNETTRKDHGNSEYEKAIKKLKENEQKIKLILERQQMDGKITDAKEKIEKLERIIYSEDKAPLKLITKFINVTDSKIKDEDLCKSVIDAFDSIVKSGDNYKDFQIPHYDPFQVIKERLGEPDYIKYTRPENDTNPTPYYLRNEKIEEEEVSGETFEGKEKVVEVDKISIENRLYEVTKMIDERTKLITGKDVLSEAITKDLISCPEHCREISVIINFDKICIPPLHLLIPIEYPKEICAIINPHFNERNRNTFLCKYISKVEQLLPYHSAYRDISNIAKTWINLALDT
ncbi:Hypothetical protein SRAE_1000043500 [Strongyloides ratti]|uniref:Mediator complex subunit 15 n=1 Tax=Strongyloides ratti TaxID=34506 RepID=A0A090KXM6_STRRB|nr:Hypothetical protein SRAE_1000043500 [Strongyloides ratti]CEF62161.1 Hypothetical protein SRAE_1000043500 [Strongyloides ratti]